MNWALLIASLAIPLLVGFLVGRATHPGRWYERLDKPRLTPPGKLFGPVWSALYLAMGVSLYLLITAEAWALVALWAAQLALNAAWSLLFFKAHQIRLALADIVALDLAVAALTITAWSVSAWASILLAPYLAWILFATYLNTRMHQMNPHD